MSSLTIKNLPEWVHRELKDASATRKRSLSSYIQELLANDARRNERRRRLRKSWPRLVKHLRSMPKVTDSTELLRQIRDGDE